MSPRSSPAQKTPSDDHALHQLGTVVRLLRERAGLTRSRLAEDSGVSLRFLAQLEGGEGNISYLRLRRVAEALGTDVASLVKTAETHARRPPVLLGMRGAGKSTVGTALAGVLHVPFLELDELVEAEAGLPLAQIFELQGEDFYRRLEREALLRFFTGEELAVLATGGGIVTKPETFSLLRERAFTVWLKARPREHWDRVVAQGDHRPMQNRPDAMAELERLWTERARMYEGADLVVNTSTRDVDDVVRDIEAAYSRSSKPAQRRTSLGA
jgi:XRE family aerobic/anaerobic benzoate catabolism transcriptional regulator